MDETFSERYQLVQQEIAEAAKRAGREPEAVKLLAVTKTWPARVVGEFVEETGHELLGENKVQEALDKSAVLPRHLQWHLIGHLQKNKARKALETFQVIESVDSLELATRLDRIASDLGDFPRVFLEVNLMGEASKFGFSPDELLISMESLLELPRLEIDGLMAIPPVVEKPEDARPYFARLRELREQLVDAFDLSVSEISMGMSHDYAIAVEEGSTLVRVGSALFGERKKKQGN